MGLFISASPASAQCGGREGRAWPVPATEARGLLPVVPALLQLHKCRAPPSPRRYCLPGPCLQVCSASQALSLFHAICRPPGCKPGPLPHALPLPSTGLRRRSDTAVPPQPSRPVISPSVRGEMLDVEHLTGWFERSGRGWG